MNRYSPKELRRQGKTIITAHSGCEKTPDNSREHILAAIASGAEMIEADIRQAADGTLYLSHDLPEDTSVRPLLRELFERIAPQESMEMNLDVKTEGLIEPVMALAKEYGLAKRIVFTGECNSDRALANSLGAEMWRSVWEDELLGQGISDNAADGSPYLNVYFQMITQEHENALREFGSSFSAWTVDDEENLRRFFEMGIANITTRTPVLAMKLRREIQGI